MKAKTLPPRRDPLTKIILMAYARGKVILQQRKQTANTPRVIEPKERNQSA